MHDAAADCVRIIDQTVLPGRLKLCELRELEEFCHAIAAMLVRGAPLIGITAAYGLAYALRGCTSPADLARACDALAATRPTAINLRWALERVRRALDGKPVAAWPDVALEEAHTITREDVAACRGIGEQALPLLQSVVDHRAGPVNILTHCNAGRLACIEWGTATSVMYLAREQGLPVHVWVSETRPRNQGASLTAWELAEAEIPYTVIADNASGALLQAGKVDLVMVGSDRTAANGDVCNKIGTYPKALLARAHGVPFYAALPLSTIDFDCPNGAAIPIEERAPAEVLSLAGTDAEGVAVDVELSVAGASAWNPAFDVTPAELVNGIVTERGVVAASPEGIASLRAGAGSAD